MNDPVALLRERLAHTIVGRHRPPAHPHAPDAVQMLTAKLLLFTGVGTTLEAWKNGSSGARREMPETEGDSHRRTLEARPIAWAPAVLGTAAAIAHAVHAFTPTERTRLATRTLDASVVAAGLLGLADTLAAARRNGELPDVGSVSLASAGLLGLLIDRSESHHEAERTRLERRARVVERWVPKRRPRIDRIVVHV